MTKICHVVESFAGGVFDFLVELVNGMPEMEHVIIYSDREHTNKLFSSLFPDSTQFILWNNATREINPKQDFAALVSLIKVLKQNNSFDIIHLHSSKAGFLGRVAARILGLQKMVIYTPHGASFLRQDVTRFKKGLFVLLEKLGSYFGGQVIACSKSEAESFLDIGIDANYVNNGICCRRWTHISRNISNRKTLRIGTIGRITAQKNPALFKGIAQALQSMYTIKFVWIGDGEMRNTLGDNIEITGWITKEKILEHLQNLDIYISTSSWEGLPLSVLQAMCAEKPLVLSNCVGNKDLVVEGHNGALFNNIDEAINKLSEMINNCDCLKIFGRNSIEMVKKDFSVTQMLQGYERIYRESSETDNS